MGNGSPPPTAPALSDVKLAWLQKNHEMAGGSTRVPPAAPSAAPASGGLPQPMQPDCKVVHNRVPGPENHLLCATHGHIVDTGSRTIIALDLKDYLKRGLGGHHQGGHHAAAHNTAPAGTPPATPAHAAGPARATPAAGAPAAQTVHTPWAAPAAGTPVAAGQPLPFKQTERDNQARAQSTGSDQATQYLRDTAADLIKNLDDSDPKVAEKKTELTRRLDALNASITATAALSDPAKQAAVREEDDKTAQALIEAAAAASTSKEATAKAQAAVQEAYKKAIIDKYGITIGGKDGKHVNRNMHYDLAYKAFEMVPLDNVVHDNMKDLQYNPGLPGIGYFSGTGIQLGDFAADATGERENPFKKEQAAKDPSRSGKSKREGRDEQVNAYAITVLHELGHSVDKRWGIMDNPSSEGRGGWQRHSAEEIAQLLAPTLGKGLDTQLVHDTVLTAVKTKQFDATPKDGVDADAWAKLGKDLAPWIKLVNNKLAWPQPQIGGRHYLNNPEHKAPRNWLSYSAQARAATYVRPYQWTAPAEWFAELYSICWHDKTPGPSKVDADVLAFLPQADGSASRGAPQ